MKYNKLKNYYWSTTTNHVKTNAFFLIIWKVKKTFIRNCKMRMPYKNAAFGPTLAKRKTGCKILLHI